MPKIPSDMSADAVKRRAKISGAAKRAAQLAPPPPPPKPRIAKKR